MKVFVAGGAGYIGTRLSNDLCASGHDVTVLDRFWFGNHLDHRVKQICTGVLKIKDDALIGYDAVVFLAGLSNDPMADFDPACNFIENGAAPAYLAYVAKKCGVPRYVYASSCSVYGFTDNEEMDENSEPSPQYPYGIAKLQAEKAIMMLEDDSFKPISIRKGTVGGWSPRMRYDLVVNTMTKYALTEGRITVNNPTLWRPLVDIRDVVQAYKLSIEADLNTAGIFNISYENYTIKRIATEIKDALLQFGHSTDILINNVADIRNYKATNQRAKDLLGFDPKYTVADSVAEIINNITKVHGSYDFSDDSYYNIATYKKFFNLERDNDY